MKLRWRMLAVLFLARMAMAFQYQIVGSVSPILMETYGVDLAGIGFLIGLYFAPGLVLALPGGWIGQRFGDKRVVAFGLGLMLLGGLVPFAWSGWGAEVTGRAVAGFGAILLNVLMTKMVVDWFAGREISTAMGIFVNSWPVGIALALIVLPALAAAGGTAAAGTAVAAYVAMSFVLFSLVYRAPVGAGVAPPATAVWPGRAAILCVVLAGMLWGLYNAAIAMVFGFGPAVLTERGLGIVEAGRATSLVLWMLAISAPLGGIVADRTGRPGAVIGICVLLSGIAFAAVLGTAGTVIPLMALGFLFGFGAGPIMGLPSEVLSGPTRALGMGLFFTVYYLAMLALPPLGGLIADLSGSAEATFRFGVALLVAALVCLALFRRFAVGVRAG